ncbi:MAG: hypothetical protein JXR81_05070 [Candidatus Goldbacteria bacterium]|nr:hypothetical protein [Candidatus Goldiibacteriota bacterium]
MNFAVKTIIPAVLAALLLNGCAGIPAGVYETSRYKKGKSFYKTAVILVTKADDSYYVPSGGEINGIKWLIKDGLIEQKVFPVVLEYKKGIRDADLLIHVSIQEIKSQGLNVYYYFMRVGNVKDVNAKMKVEFIDVKTRMPVAEITVDKGMPSGEKYHSDAIKGLLSDAANDIISYIKNYIQESGV